MKILSLADLLCPLPFSLKQEAFRINYEIFMSRFCNYDRLGVVFRNTLTRFVTDVLSPLKFSYTHFMGNNISGRLYANGRVSYDYCRVLIRNVRRMGSTGPWWRVERREKAECKGSVERGWKECGEIECPALRAFRVYG